MLMPVLASTATSATAWTAIKAHAATEEKKDDNQDAAASIVAVTATSEYAWTAITSTASAEK